jgi:hypothetical protein
MFLFNAKKLKVSTQRPIFIDLTDFFPSKVRKIKRWLRSLKVKQYKARKLKEAKLTPKETYKLYFTVVINDDSGPKESEVFDITIPAYSVYFAKKMLESYIKEQVTVNITNFETINEEEL